MSGFYDDLEIRDPSEREEWLAEALPAAIGRAKRAPALARLLASFDAPDICDRASLATLPVIRKADLSAAQKRSPPFGGYTTRLASEFDHIFQSPGPVYEPGRREGDWWRLGRFLHACGIGRGDIVQNCFSYHLGPAGMMFDSGARAVDAAVIPAGTGQVELQVRAAADIGATAYVGTPEYLRVILDQADQMGETLSITRAAVCGAPLVDTLRRHYTDRGVQTRQCYATTDLGNIAYESEAMDGMIVDEGVIIEIVRSGTDDLVPEGEVGEVVVTTLNADYPLVRFATGDLSAVLQGSSPCGRTNMRIKGWMGRVDEADAVQG